MERRLIPVLSGTTLPQDGRLVTGRRPVLKMTVKVYRYGDGEASVALARGQCLLRTGP
jgi:hypothetical protein